MCYFTYSILLLRCYNSPIYSIDKLATALLNNLQTYLTNLFDKKPSRGKLLQIASYTKLTGQNPANNMKDCPIKLTTEMRVLGG